MMNKKICLLMITIMAAVLLSGCNLKEKISESITEEIIGKAADGEIDAEIDGDEYEWPEDQAASYLPKLENGTITYVLNGPDTCMLLVEDLSIEEYRDYRDAISEAGFTDDVLESSVENIEIYSGTSSDGFLATLSFEGSEGTLQITVEKKIN